MDSTDEFSLSTERQERCTRADAWRMAKGVLKLKEKDKGSFFSLTEVWCLPAPSVIKPEEREFVVDAGASMHMLSRKDLSSADLETVRISKNRITVARWMGCPRRAVDRRRRTRVCPEPACVQTPFWRVAHAGRKGELTSCRGTVKSAWLSTSSRRTDEGEKTGLPSRVSGRQVVRGRQSSPFPAQQQAVVGGSEGVHQGNRHWW